MKSAGQWADELQSKYGVILSPSSAAFILAIQRDAIQAAAGKCAKISDEYNDTIDDLAGYGASKCEAAILSLLPEAKT
jgi:hypothetical protein